MSSIKRIPRRAAAPRSLVESWLVACCDERCSTSSVWSSSRTVLVRTGPGYGPGILCVDTWRPAGAVFIVEPRARTSFKIMQHEPTLCHCRYTVITHHKADHQVITGFWGFCPTATVRKIRISCYWLKSPKLRTSPLDSATLTKTIDIKDGGDKTW